VPAPKSEAFHALHAVYHERDFRVRVNEPTINMVQRILALEVNVEVKYDAACPACKAGYHYLHTQPNDADRRG